MGTYGLSTTVPLPYDRAVEKTREALTSQGFGVITEIDVKKTMKEKL
ncbi:MAG: ABC transporter, partial [Armatimonadetes bacterium]|nr:ABC transporter [Armatimonadota bacterium]